MITKLAGLGDIRQIGSGNIGATNVLRTGRKDLALLTLLLDIGKAGIAFLICWQAAHAILVTDNGDITSDVYDAVSRSNAYSIGLCGGAFAFVGHCFPVWLRLQGRQGRRDLRRPARRGLMAGRRRFRRHLAADRTGCAHVVVLGAA